MENSTEWVEGIMGLLLFCTGMMLFLGGIYAVDKLIEHLALGIFRDYVLWFI